jgi:FixJ family two-component response regulator
MIFIVDDDHATRDSLRLLVECEGFAARDFASGRLFLDGARPTDGDCLILDLNMPGMSGFEVLAELSRRSERVPVIVITARSDPSTKRRAKAAGAAAFLDKPLVAEQLLTLVRTMLAVDQNKHGAIEKS